MRNRESIFHDKSLEYNKTHEIFETIGQKILDSWNSDDESIDSFFVTDPLIQLNKILQTPYNDFDSIKLDELQDILNNFQPEDYALYGKRVCQYMINYQKYQLQQKNSFNSTSKEFQTISKNEKKEFISKDSHIRAKKVTKTNLFSSFPEWIPTITA